jgi:hypothetical protein
MYCNETVIRGTWGYPGPSALRIQVRRVASSLATVGGNDHWQLAKNSIPTLESIWVICALQNLLQDRRRKPHGLPAFEG